MNFSQLEYFVCVCEERSISAAAKKIHMSQQSVSAAIASLEKELGVLLLVRSAKGVHRTEVGEAVYKRAKEILKSSLELKHEALEMGEKRLDDIVMAYQAELFSNYSSTFFADVIEGFKEENPQIRLKTFEGNAETCMKLVHDGLADLGAIATLTTPSDLEVIELAQASLMLYVPRDHPFAEKRVISVSDLMETKITLTSFRDLTLHAYVSNCRKHGFTPQLHKVQMPLDDYYDLLSIENKIGIILTTQRAIETNETHKPIPFVPEDSIDIFGLAIFRKNERLNPTVHALARYLSEQFNRG